MNVRPSPAWCASVWGVPFVCSLENPTVWLRLLSCSLKAWVDPFEDKERTSGRWAIFSEVGPGNKKVTRVACPAETARLSSECDAMAVC